MAAAYILIATVGLAFALFGCQRDSYHMTVIAAIAALIILSLFLAAAEYILMREPDAKGWEAVKKSKKIMTGNTGRYFGFLLSFIGWFALTALFFPLAIYTLPYFFTANTYFLGSIYDEAEKRAQEPVYEVPVYNAAPVSGDVPQEAAPTKFCKHCGSRIPQEAVFCSGCGQSQVLETPPVKEELHPAAEEVTEAPVAQADEQSLKESAEPAAEQTEVKPVDEAAETPVEQAAEKPADETPEAPAE